jgi:short-subunit dehydrogenase
MGTAIVTGASSGIGLELARLLARDGHDVVLVARSEERLAALAGELPGARSLPLDLSDPAAPAKLEAEVPSADVLVNNAGVGTYGPFAAADLGRTMAMIQLNVSALTELTHRYLPGMIERGAGRVLNVASTAAFQPGPLMAVYYATKAYVLSFSEAVGEELRGTGVTVTALCPGPTASGFQAEAAMESSRLVAGRRLPSSAAVAEAGYKAMLAGKPVAVVGIQNRILAGSVRLAPRSVVRRVVRFLQEPR